MKRVFIIFISTLLGCMFLIIILFYLLVNGNVVANYTNKMVGDEFHVTIASATLNPFTRTLRTEDVSIITGNGEEEVDFFTAETLTAGKIGLFDALRGDVSFGYVTLENFTLNQQVLPEKKSNQNSEENPASLSAGSVELRNGTIIFTTEEGGHGKIEGLNLFAGPVAYHPDCNECTDFDIIQNVEIEIPALDFTFWDDRYRLTINSIFVSEGESEVKIGKILVKPTLSDRGFFDSLEFRTELFSVDLSGFIIEDVDFSGIRESERFAATVISLDSLDLHVTLDKAVEEEPDPGFPPMPMQMLNDLPFDVAVDSLLVHHADIRYSEYHEEGARPGTIYFGNTKAQMVHIYSGSSDPVQFTAQTFLEGTGELNTEINMSIEGTQSVTDVKGSLGRFEADRLNNIFVDLEGIQIKDGIVHGLEFEFQMLDDRSDGFIMIHYDQFSIELLDRVDHDQSLGDRIVGFFMDQVAMRSSSETDEADARTGEISEERDPEKGFFNYLWVSLRSGIMDVIRRI